MKLFGKHVWKMAGLLLMVSLISLAVISGTFAKYTSTLAGQDTALVAKWDITGGTGSTLEMNEGGTAQLNLFKHSYDINIKNKEGNDYIIAPGVEGQFDLKFANKSDVAAKVKFKSIVESGSAFTSSNVPIRYTLVEGATPNRTAAELATDLSDANNPLVADLQDIDAANGANPGLAQVTVYWGWVFERENGGKDGEDTGFGTASATAAATGTRTDYTLTITATAEQLEPGPTP